MRYIKGFLVPYGSTGLGLSNFGAFLFNPSYHGNAYTAKCSPWLSDCICS